MNYEKYKDFLTDYVNSITTKSPRNKSNYICPICNSGNGANGTGAFSLKGNLWHCFSCNAGGDIYDLYQRVNNCDQATAYKGIEAMYGGLDGPTIREEPRQDETRQERETAISNAHLNIITGMDDGKGLDYFIGRGFSLDTVKRFNLGYNGRNAIIPYNNTSYLERGLEGNFKRNHGATGLFICTRDKNKNTWFICEGWADALSLWEIGHNSISVNSTTNYEKAVELFKGHQEKEIVIAFDNDEPGERASDQLLNELRKENLNCVKFDYKQMKSNYKDINEYYINDREELRKECYRMAIEANMSDGERRNDEIGINTPGNEKNLTTAHSEVKTIETSVLKVSNMVDYITDRYINDIESKKTIRKSGFQNLDTKFNGGFYPGLYVLGAVSSLGKTTFLLNIADNMAKNGEDVLFFSLEQSTIELFTKSLSRIIATKKDNRGKRVSCSAMDLRMRRLTRSQEQEEHEARIEYMQTIAPHMNIIECNFDTNIIQIVNTIKAYMTKTGKKPVVFVDYLQIIPPRDPRMTERQNADDIVRALKKVQADNDLLLFAVSSFNRNSYLNPIDYESFKESGGIEYTADCILGLQLQAITEERIINEKKDTVKREILKEEKRANPRKIEMVCLKNRGGVSSFSCFFNYYPNCDLYEEGSPLKVESNNYINM